MVGVIDAAVGFAGANGRGVAYARLSSNGAEHLLRVPFRFGASCDERQIGFAALTALAATLRRRGLRRVYFALEDRELLDDIAAHENLKESLALPYVRLRCAFNALDEVTTSYSPDANDLTQRAKAEVAFLTAA